MLAMVPVLRHLAELSPTLLKDVHSDLHSQFLLSIGEFWQLWGLNSHDSGLEVSHSGLRLCSAVN